jgi:uncharacterized membrane protein YgcG
MKRSILAALVVMAAGALFAQGTAVQVGDSELDNAFGNMNAIRVENLNGFYGQVAARYRYQEAQLRRFAEQNRLSPSEVYMVAFMARTRNMSMERVMQTYRTEGSWSGAAQSLGITLRSREMDRLRTQAKDDMLQIQTRDRDRDRSGTMEQSGSMKGGTENGGMGGSGSGGGGGSGSGSGGGMGSRK